MYKSKYANLMKHLMNEHDLILLDSEQQEIEKWVDKDLTEQCNIPDVVHSKTQPKIAVVGCGGEGITVVRRLAEKGFDAVAIHDLNNTPLTLSDISKPKEIEPLILKQTIPDDYFNKPQNRADRRKKARNKGKKKNR